MLNSVFDEILPIIGGELETAVRTLLSLDPRTFTPPQGRVLKKERIDLMQRLRLAISRSHPGKDMSRKQRLESLLKRLKSFRIP